MRKPPKAKKLEPATVDEDDDDNNGDGISKPLSNPNKEKKSDAE